MLKEEVYTKNTFKDVHKIALAMTNIAEYLNHKYMKDAELEEK